MSVLLTDSVNREQLLPLTFTRPIGALRPGIFSIAEAWEERTGENISFHTHECLGAVFPTDNDSDRVVYGGLLFPNELVDRVIVL